MGRRDVIRAAAGATALVLFGGIAQGQRSETMYGIIGQMTAQRGKRVDLIAILAAGTRDMPGNIAYVIAEDRENENALWITEIWDSRESHAASLELPGVQAAIAEGRPLIAGMGHRFETTPVAGV